MPKPSPPKRTPKAHHRVDLVTAAALGCSKCADEHETGCKTTQPHKKGCPRSRRYRPDGGAPSSFASGDGGDGEEDVDGMEIDAPGKGGESPDAPLRIGNCIDFPVSNLHSHLICSLCSGYFRDPHTVADCLHTFCGSCLILFLRQGMRCCPTCNARLGPNPFYSSINDHAPEVVPDRTLEEVVNKIFPSMKAQEDEEERAFYSQRGIELKPEYLQEERAHKRAAAKKAYSPTKKMIDLMDLRLEPDQHPPHSHQKLPPLREPHLLLTGSAKIATLKKYLVQKLGLKESKSLIEILCNGDSMGDELSLTFIFRTRWLFAPEEMFTLKYRLEEEGHAR